MDSKKKLSASINLRSLTIDDFNQVLNWSKDELFCSTNGWEINRNSNELFRWWRHCVNNVDEDFIRMGIELNGQLIGYTDLAFIMDNTAELGIAIGESRLWGKGIGFHSALCMMDHASKKLGITTFKAETDEENIRSRKMLEKLGFKEISRSEHEDLGRINQLIQYRLKV